MLELAIPDELTFLPSLSLIGNPLLAYAKVRNSSAEEHHNEWCFLAEACQKLECQDGNVFRSSFTW